MDLLNRNINNFQNENLILFSHEKALHLLIKRENTFCFTGTISNEIKNRIYQDLKCIMSSIGRNSLLQRRILFVFDECTTNVIDYYNQLEKKFVFVFKYYLNTDSKKEILSFKSYLHNRDKLKLKKSLNYIKNEPNDVINEIFLAKLISENSSRNAGIGLLLIKKNSQSDINFSFTKLENSWWLLELNFEFNA